MHTSTHLIAWHTHTMPDNEFDTHRDTQTHGETHTDMKLAIQNPMLGEPRSIYEADGVGLQAPL
jgi:hypothetical protein